LKHFAVKGNLKAESLQAIIHLERILVLIQVLLKKLDNVRTYFRAMLENCLRKDRGEIFAIPNTNPATEDHEGLVDYINRLTTWMSTDGTKGK
jgi:hypothetical protein